MKLKSFGCSFIFGTDLHDDGRDLPYATPSLYTWPALLSQRIGYSYECYARPGSGNLQIWENVANQIARQEPALYVIGWTWVDRFDYISEDSSNWMHRTKWRTIMPIDEDTVAKNYHKSLHSEHLDKMKSLIYIQSVIDLLTKGGHPFIMTSMDDLLLDQRWNCSPGMIPVQESIRPYLTSFNGDNFLDYSRKNGHNISETWHPLESAHAAAADLMLPAISSILHRA